VHSSSAVLSDSPQKNRSEEGEEVGEEQVTRQNESLEIDLKLLRHLDDRSLSASPPLLTIYPLVGSLMRPK
jgi:hypothetical protein